MSKVQVSEISRVSWRSTQAFHPEDMAGSDACEDGSDAADAVRDVLFFEENERFAVMPGKGDDHW